MKTRRYNALVLNGRLRLAVHIIMACDGGSVLVTEEPCHKDGTKTVGEVLATKQPHLCVPDLSDPECMCFKLYPAVPKDIRVNVSLEVVMKMAPSLSGGAGPSGIDAVTLCYWLLHFNCASGEMHEEMV